MKKRIQSVVLSVVMLVCFAGCGTTYQEATGQKESGSNTDFGNGYFTEVSHWESPFHNYTIYYANDTKVKYLVFVGSYQFGITPLYNADGTLQVYEETKPND